MRAWLRWHLNTQESCYSILCTHFPIEWCDNLMRAASHCWTIALSCFFSLCFFSAWSFRAVWTVWTVGCRNSCTKETLALPCLQRNLETSSFFDISWKFSTKPCEYQRTDNMDRSCSCCACCRYSCWPLTTLSERKITIHLESSVFSFFSFFFLGIELSWCRWWSQDKHVRLPRLTQLCLASLESLPFLFLPMASTEVGCVLLSLAFLFAVLHLFASFLNLP